MDKTRAPDGRSDFDDGGGCNAHAVHTTLSARTTDAGTRGCVRVCMRGWMDGCVYGSGGEGRTSVKSHGAGRRTTDASAVVVVVAVHCVGR